jgi:hypothetical protein
MDTVLGRRGVRAVLCSAAAASGFVLGGSAHGDTGANRTSSSADPILRTSLPVVSDADQLIGGPASTPPIVESVATA